MNSDLPSQITEALEGRYTVDRELGRGGMATVFLARDLKHERPVALKVLHPELAAGLAAERFLREIRIAANLQHPHIVPLYDSGEVEALLYYVMPYVDGESLRERLERDGPLPVDEALRIGREVADALEYAHRSDIVHRDIKPENILLAGNHAVVADFGIATAVSSAADQKTLTQTGLVIGTPTYLSPEQAEGADLDGRSDLYSLGCVMYEMLAGRPPFEGPTAMAILAQQAVGEVTPLTQLRPELPAGVEQVVLKTLASEANERFADVAEFREALRSAPTAAVQPSEPAPEAAGRSIAVMPFRNMSADPENEYFCEGMAEEIINAMSRVPGLEVASRTSSFAFKDKDLEIREIGRQLDVSTVLEGSVRQAGKKLRITAQLIKVADGYHLWSERFDREIQDVFAIQDEIAAAIVKSLEEQLGGRLEQVPTIKRGTDNLDAYHLYLKGRHFWEKRALPKALECFQEATALDPKYAAPCAGIADAFTYLGHYGLVPTPQAAPKAIGAAERAVALDDELGDAHFSLGLARLFFWYLDEAESELRRAIQLNPQHAVARVYLGVYLATTGRAAEVPDTVEPAREIDPLSPIVNGVAGIAYFWTGDYERALEGFERALEMDPTFIPALYMRGFILSGQEAHDEGIATLEKAVEALPCPLTLQILGGAYADAGQPGKAREVLTRLMRQREESYATALSISYIFAKLEDMDESLDWMEKAFAERNTFAWTAAFVGGMENMASDPRYISHLKKAGLTKIVPGLTDPAN